MSKPISHHPDMSTLMGFSAGTLDDAYAMLVSAHLSGCEACREQMARLDTLGGAMLETEESAPLSDSALDRLMSALDDEDPISVEPRKTTHDDVPPALAEVLPKGLDGAKWKLTGPSIWKCDLPVSAASGSRLMMLKVGPNAAMPEHGHHGHELTMVLRGSYTDKFGQFATGDIADMDEDVDHQPIADGDGCICIFALDARLDFRSRLMKVLQPFIGI